MDDALLHVEGWRVNHKKVERQDLVRHWSEDNGRVARGMVAASAATQEATAAQSQGQFDHPLEAHASEPCLGHPLPGRRLQSNLPKRDFVHDRLSNGRSYKMLTVLDEVARQALAVTARTGMRADDVLEALYPLQLRHGSPEYIRSDNGPEFAAEAVQGWLRRPSRQIALQSPAGQWMASNRAAFTRDRPARTDTTSGATGHYDRRLSMRSGSRRPSRPRSSSITG
ncbi:MAG: DDE-type integrase/transposase/recombinase [Pseudomonadota bacterium]